MSIEVTGARSFNRAPARLAWRLIRILGMGLIMLRVHPRSALRAQGWFKSFRRRESVDGNGRPIPWWTYAAIHFLESRISISLRVLEFGAGSSTLWLGQRVASVFACENNRTWADRLRPCLPTNVHLQYSATIIGAMESISDKQYRFDVLVNDADADRIECARAAMPLLSPTGVVIWDNTDGPDWPAIEKCMGSFREISFVGMTPQEVATSRTTIFYRRDNCLGI